MGSIAPIAIFVIQELIKYEPQVAAAIGQLLTKTDATAADWAALAVQYPRKTYESVVTESGLIPTDPPTTVVP